MTAIFDLTRIKKLIEKEDPTAAIVVDSAILVHHTDLTRWKTSIQKPLFILPCYKNSVKEPPGNAPQSPAEDALELPGVFHWDRGCGVEEGTYKEGAGWFITPPVPDKISLKSEMEDLGFLIKALGLADTSLIILARELARNFPCLPLIFISKNKDLLQVARFTGINACLFQVFSKLKLEKMKPGPVADSVNWDDILQGIQADTEKKVVQVELTLLSKGCAPKWVVNTSGSSENTPVVVAEGTGIIHGATDIRFTWALPFLAWDLPDLDESASEEDGPGEDYEPADTDAEELALGIAYLDFGGLEHSVSPGLAKALINKINECASPLAYMEDMPTVQDPVAVMKQLLIFEFAFQERKSATELSRESLEEFEQKLSNNENLLSWAHYWLRDRDVDSVEKDISFNEFLHAIKSCWSIGDTIMIQLHNDPAEISNLKGEAGE